ncbi:MAG: transglutaminase-like domain-containing protein [Thermodesulfobacteriota bacterium]|nr:transglutaminase-like domain-containing protein [Thermodesulfobacteriota bacterium]
MLARLRLSLAVKLLVILFWGLMVFLLVKRIHLAPEVTIVETERLKDSETWMSVFFKGRKVGYSVQSLTRIETGYVVDQKTYLRLNLMGQVRELRTLTSARLNKSLGLKSFNFFMSSGPVRYQLTGRLVGLVLELTSQTAGHKSKSRLNLEKAPRLATGLMAYLTREGLEKGQRFQVPIFDPSTLSSRQVQVAVEDREKLVIDGQTMDTYRIRMNYFGNQSYTWVDTEGRTVKEEGLLGLSLVRTTAKKAKEGLAGRAELTDVVAATSAPTNRRLDHPRQVRFLRARLNGLELAGFELDGGRQRLAGNIVEVTRETIDFRHEVRLPVKDPIFKPDLESTNFIQSRDPKIISQTRAITGGIGSPLKAVNLVVDWVFENLEKRPTMSIPSALDVLDTKVGDCNEHAVLAAALLRASGVPAKIAVGVLYFEGRFYYHAWLEVFWGRWMAVDPVLGQVPADATHIRFLTGGLSRQADMVRLIGRLEVEVLEVR